MIPIFINVIIQRFEKKKKNNRFNYFLLMIFNKVISNLFLILAKIFKENSLWHPCFIAFSVDLSVRALFHPFLSFFLSAKLFHAEASPHGGIFRPRIPGKVHSESGTILFCVSPTVALGERAWLQAGRSRAWIARIICWDYFEGSVRRLCLQVSVSLFPSLFSPLASFFA